MSTRSVEYLGTAGSYSVQSPAISNTTIYGVKREGLGYSEDTGTPGNRGFVYDSTAGTITFEQPFTDIEFSGRLRPEKVWILFKL